MEIIDRERNTVKGGGPITVPTLSGIKSTESLFDGSPTSSDLNKEMSGANSDKVRGGKSKDGDTRRNVDL